jgi:hypothetical protein
MGFFDSFFNVGDPQAAAAAQTAALQQGDKQLNADLTKGRTAITTNYGAGIAPIQANYNLNAGGANTYADATGANGAAGYDRAVTNFRTDPGYRFALDQGNENILRNAARTGALNSGETNIDLLNYGQGLADQQYGNYVNRLQPFLGGATVNAGNIGQMYANEGNALDKSFTTQGNAAYGTQVGIGNAQASADLATGPFWGLAGGAINAFAKGAGMAVGKG